MSSSSSFGQRHPAVSSYPAGGIPSGVIGRQGRLDSVRFVALARRISRS